MAHVVCMHETGGPSVLILEELDVPHPGPGEIRIRQSRCGVNFIDIYYRSGLYPVALPFVLGQEGAGEVVAVGPRVTGFSVGDRVACSTVGGGYASERVISADLAFRLPDWVSDDLAAAYLMKGLTAQMLLRQTFRVGAGTVMLVHAAAGGVGTILSQWGASLGATVIGTVGADEKVAVARDNGCAEVIVYTREDFAERVRAVTRGGLCDVVYDGVGRDTWKGSLDCLRPRGMFVSYGNASGPVQPFAMLELARRGSLFATRPILHHYATTRAECLAMADEFFAALKDGVVRAPEIRPFALSEAGEAHRLLASRGTTGCLVLVP